MTKYISTRDASAAPIDFIQAMMTGLAPDGGLYVPQDWPSISGVTKNSTYLETANIVMGALVGDAIPQDDLARLIADTYTPRADGFSTDAVTPLRKLDDQLSVLELFHGPTLAFKDVALQMLGRMFDYELHKTNQKITILGATSGDTGSAAIEGCRHADGVRMFILYPHERPSDVQRRQMTTVKADGIHAIAVQGSFDDCQDIVKELMNDHTFRNEHTLSAVNSINWARISAQIVYYVHTAYKYDVPVNFIVPTGNFGNIYAAYVAKKMGAPINKLVVASNRNDILTRFFETGLMKMRTVEQSHSPSMDIQISSNFERLLFDMLDRDAGQLNTIMKNFKQDGSFNIAHEVLDRMRSTFDCARCNDEQTLQTINQTYEKYKYLMDPHTACGMHAYEVLKDELDGPVITLACAHSAKFPDAVNDATGVTPDLPESLSGLMTREEHFDVLPSSADAVRKFIETH